MATLYLEKNDKFEIYALDTEYDPGSDPTKNDPGMPESCEFDLFIEFPHQAPTEIDENSTLIDYFDIKKISDAMIKAIKEEIDEWKGDKLCL